MPKRVLSPSELFDLRQALQVATLDAMMASRRWEPGDLAFQGGTSLCLAYGSPRFSEDLDFLVRSTLRIDAIEQAVETRLAGTGWLPAGTGISVSRAKDAANPHAFVVTIGGANVIGAARVKVEMWRTPASVLQELQVRVVPVRLARGSAAGIQAFVPVLEPPEIYADKVFALVARPYLKPRDVFDLHWLRTRNGPCSCSPKQMQARLATYPAMTAEGWLEAAGARYGELERSHAVVQRDLAKWLPASWPLDEERVAEMVDGAGAALAQGLVAMRELLAPAARSRAAERN